MHHILVFTLFVFLHVPACSRSVVPTDGCRFWMCRHSLQMCVIYGCWFCRRKGMHFRNEWVCHFVSSLCYLAVCWQSPSLYKVAIFFGVMFPIFPPGTEDTRTQPFRNAGASCYINATLQAFFGLSEIRGLCADILRSMSDARRNALLRADHRCVDDAVLPHVDPVKAHWMVMSCWPSLCMPTNCQQDLSTLSSFCTEFFGSPVYMKMHMKPVS